MTQHNASLCINIQKRVLEILENDPALKEYVADFGIGEANVSRKIFPYVTVAEATGEVEPLCVGRAAPNLNRYRIVVHGGARHTLPEVARAGDENGKKGAVQMADDIVAALWPGNVGGLFKPTVRLRSAGVEEFPGSAGQIWRATVELSGGRKA